jgi:protocatechuate 4,5-dioxygenase beta chain
MNKEFDLLCMDKIVSDPERLIGYSSRDLVQLAGAQGVEFLNWLVMRGALTGRVSKLHSQYHIPISNTAAGLLLLENAA